MATELTPVDTRECRLMLDEYRFEIEAASREIARSAASLRFDMTVPVTWTTWKRGIEVWRRGDSGPWQVRASVLRWEVCDGE